jgi:hypothetical protein
MTRLGWIYYLRFPNGKGYVGQTRHSVAKRFAKHRYCFLNGKSGALYAAWHKYGEPVCTPLFSCSVPELNAQEILLIAALQTYAPNGYNLTTGGDTPEFVSDATREKRSRAMTGRKASPETRRRLSEVHTGKPGRRGWVHSPETRAKMSAAKMGKPVPAERKAKISASMLAMRAAQRAARATS